MIEVKKIKTIDDMQIFIEGCVNDYESGICTKSELLEDLKNYTFHVIDLGNNNLFNYVSNMSKTLFPKSTSLDHLRKLKHESDEAILQPGDLMEYADITIALLSALYKQGFNFNDLVEAVVDKVKINLSRKWELKSDGTYQHIES